MTAFTFTATATDTTTGQTGQGTAGFTVGAASGAVISPAAGPWTASGNGTRTLSVGPTAAGNLLTLVVGAGGAGQVNSLSAGISGGGATTWIRLSGYLNTGDHTLVELWQGVVVTPGASTITVTNASMATEWNRLWAREFTASGASINWQTVLASPAAPVTSASPSGTGTAVHYPTLTGQGLYVGAAADSYGLLNAGTTAGFTWATVDSHLQTTWNAAASGAAPASTSSDSGEHWSSCAALITATSTPVSLSVATGSLPGGVTTVAYSQSLTAAGGVPPYVWALASGSLPAGLTLSAAGLISGTPTATGTASFTVKVTDSAAHIATAVLSIAVTASPPVIATLTYANNAYGVRAYTAPAMDPQMSLAGNTQPPFVDLNVWGGVPGEAMTAQVYSARSWNLTASMSNPDGSVTCFPNTGIAYPVSLPWNSYSYFISGWDEQMDATTSQIASACYDNWVDNTLVNPLTNSAVVEIMLHFDFRNRGAGPWYAQGVQFGGYTVNGIPIPVTRWNLAYQGTAVYWNLVDSGGAFTNLPIGAVDLLAMNRYLVTAGFISSTCHHTGVSVGYELCDTQGAPRNYRYNNVWCYAALQEPAVALYITGVSADGTYFVDQNSNPRMLISEDIWALPPQAGVSNGGNWQGAFDTYFAQRAAQGYTGAEVCLISSGDLNVNCTYFTGQDWDGEWPFAGSNDPTTTPNETFWTRRDYMFDSAQAHGITMIPNFPGVGDTSACRPWSNAQWTAYGTFLGTRYASQPNILWICGDGTFGVYDTGLSYWLTAARAAGDTHPIAYQGGDETSSRRGFGSDNTGADPQPFMVNAQFDWVYTYNTSYQGCISACVDEPSGSDVVQGRVPVIWGDGTYLASGQTAPQTDVHLEQNLIWWALTSGACGVSTGDNDIFPWAAGSAAAVTSKSFYTTVMPAITSFWSGLSGWQKLRPDSASALVTSGRNTQTPLISTTGSPYSTNNDNYVTAAFAADGSLAVIYCGRPFTITINQAKMTPGYGAYWVDPATCAKTVTTAGASYNSGLLGNNSTGFADWALVLAAPPYATWVVP